MNLNAFAFLTGIIMLFFGIPVIILDFKMGSLRREIEFLRDDASATKLGIVAAIAQLRGDFDKLMQSHAALQRTVEGECGCLSTQIDKLQKDFDQWPKWRNDLVDALLDMGKHVEDIHVTTCRPKKARKP